MSKRIFTWIMLLAVAFCLLPNLSHARWYDPETGQYLSPDPVFDFPQNYGNPHSYVGQNPVNRIDPTGTQTLNEVVQSLAVRAYMGYDQYSNVRDVVSVTSRIAAGQGVAGYEVAMIMWSLLPNTPNPPKIKHIPLNPGRNMVPDDEIRAFNEAVRRYAPALGTNKQIGEFGEMALKQRGVTRGLVFLPSRKDECLNVRDGV